MTRAVVRVHVVYAERDVQRCAAIELPDGARVQDALDAAAGRDEFRGLDLEHLPVGVFGERVGRETQLAEGDRVELYRPLVTDPKDQRRRRAR